MAERMVTRRVIKSKEYDVFSLEGGNLRKIDHIKVTGRISEKELAREYGVEKIVTECTKEEKAIYGVPVSVFMKHAIELNDERENNE